MSHILILPSNADIMSLEVAVPAAPAPVAEGGGVVVDAPRAEVRPRHAPRQPARALDGGQQAARHRPPVVRALALRLAHLDLRCKANETTLANHDSLQEIL